MRIRITAIAALALGLIACNEVNKAVVGPLPAERGTECRANCAALGMQLTSVVLIMNSTGCVCQVIDAAQPPGAPPVASAQSAAAAIVGGAAIAATAAAAAQQHSQQSAAAATMTSQHK
jgi:hypothetical protein